jgi:hypothetical protein
VVNLRDQALPLDAGTRGAGYRRLIQHTRSD